jgi:signal transduction histidine kinase
MIAEHVQFAARLIAELFDTVQAGRRAIALTPALLDLHALVRHAVDDSRQAALSARLEVAMDLGAQRHWVNGDRLRLLQILWNLMNNALKFTPAHGSIHIRTFNTAAPAVIVEVEDTGIGLAARDLKKIFDPFEQAGPGKRRGGLGLGLSLSRELARLHGGDLTARSEGEGRGSVFVLTLPTARESALDAR